MPKQRARLKESVTVVGVRVAIVTSSVLARAAGLAVRWFNPHLCVVVPGELERALDYLELWDECRQEAQAVWRRSAAASGTRRSGTPP